MIWAIGKQVYNNILTNNVEEKATTWAIRKHVTILQNSPNEKAPKCGTKTCYRLTTVLYNKKPITKAIQIQVITTKLYISQEKGCRNATI